LVVFVHRNYVTPLLANENHVFYLFGHYSALIWPTSNQSWMQV